MKGSEILNEVRFLINDMGYTRYSEINRAYREMGRITRHNWLRGQSEEMVEFADGVTSYWLDLAGIRVLKALWVKGNDSGAKYWHLMEEVSNQLFEDKRVVELLQRCASQSADNLVASVREAIKDFAGKAPQSDDITLLSFQWTG